jgi:hypothetical protein
MNMEQQWDNINRRKQQEWEKYLSHCHPVNQNPA